MKISNLIPTSPGRHKFHLNVGGFTIKNCRWNANNGQILFPVRYDTRGRRFRVIRVPGVRVNKLRALLESGETALPRDRTPCAFGIRFLGVAHQGWPQWIIFSFTVRGFTIIGCRWHREKRSIQLPVTFQPNEQPWRMGPQKKQIVCAFGVHINRLRQALVVKWDKVYGARDRNAPHLHEAA